MILVGLSLFWIGYVFGHYDGEENDSSYGSLVMMTVTILTVLFFALKGAGVNL